VTVDPDGNIKIDAVGFKGKACQITKVIEEALGTVKSDTKKPEYFQTISTSQTVGGK